MWPAREIAILAKAIPAPVLGVLQGLNVKVMEAGHQRRPSAGREPTGPGAQSAKTILWVLFKKPKGHGLFPKREVEETRSNKHKDTVCSIFGLVSVSASFRGSQRKPGHPKKDAGISPSTGSGQEGEGGHRRGRQRKEARLQGLLRRGLRDLRPGWRFGPVADWPTDASGVVFSSKNGRSFSRAVFLLRMDEVSTIFIGFWLKHGFVSVENGPLRWTGPLGLCPNRRFAVNWAHLDQLT